MKLRARDDARHGTTRRTFNTSPPRARIVASAFSKHALTTSRIVSPVSPASCVESTTPRARAWLSLRHVIERVSVPSSAASLASRNSVPRCVADVSFTYPTMSRKSTAAGNVSLFAGTDANSDAAAATDGVPSSPRSRSRSRRATCESTRFGTCDAYVRSLRSSLGRGRGRGRGRGLGRTMSATMSATVRIGRVNQSTGTRANLDEGTRRWRRSAAPRGEGI